MAGDTRAAYTDPNTLCERHAQERPGKIFIESPDQASRVTFGDFEALTRRFANFLAQEGVRFGDRVSILSDNAIEALVVFWGALRAGVIVNPINVEIREKHVSQILYDVAPKLVFWSSELSGAVRALGTGSAAWVPFGAWTAPSPPADDLFARLRVAPAEYFTGGPGPRRRATPPARGALTRRAAARWPSA